ncbi:MAG: metallophosphoesterase [Candidatus Helarchaeota archaeon]|nr:metallophosphoesterase [Candidatus Helarchaeota archaeon]
MTAAPQKQKKRRFLKVMLCILIMITTPALIAVKLGIFLSRAPPTDLVLVNFTSCDPKTEAMLSWNSATDTQTELWIGTSSNNLTAYTTINNSDATGIATIHRVHVRNLTAGQKYYYKTSLNGPIGSFSTAPAIAGSSFHALLVSDTQHFYFNGYYERIAQMVGKDPNPAFFMIAGDLVDEGTLLEGWSHFLEKSRPWISKTPLVPVAGNHEEIQEPDSYYWDYMGPEEVDSFGNRTYYAFNWSNALFVCMEIANGEHEDMSSLLQADQLLWLQTTLANGMSQEFRVVMFHRPVFSPMSHGIFYQSTLTTLVPTLEAYNVSLVIYGHDHVYGRYRYNNITYLCHGCGGGLNNQLIYIPSQEEIDQNVPGLVIQRLSLVPAVTKLDFSNTTLTITTTSIDNLQFDSTTLEVSTPGHLTREVS